MLVRIGNRLINTREEPVLLVLTEHEIEAIATLDPYLGSDNHVFFKGPEGYPPHYEQVFRNIGLPRKL